MSGRTLAHEDFTEAAAVWPEPENGRLFCSVPWLSAFRGRMEGAHHWFLASEQGCAPEPAVAAMGTVVDEVEPTEAKNIRTLLTSPCPSMRTLRRLNLDRLDALASHSPPWGAWAPSLVVTYPGFECLVARSPSARQGDVDVLVRTILDQAVASGWRTVAFLFVPTSERELHASLLSAGLIPFYNATSSVLSLPDGGYEEYLASLGRKQRADARRLTRLAAELGWTFADGGLDETSLDAMVRMRLDERRKHGRRVDRTHESMVFETMREHFADRVSVTMASDADGPAGFSLYLAAEPGTEHAWTQGVRGDLRQSRDMYLACTYYQAIERAYERAVCRIDFGHGAEDTKRQRGCEPALLTGYVWSLDRRVREYVERVSQEVFHDGLS